MQHGWGKRGCHLPLGQACFDIFWIIIVNWSIYSNTWVDGFYQELYYTWVIGDYDYELTLVLMAQLLFHNLTSIYFGVDKKIRTRVFSLPFWRGTTFQEKREKSKTRNSDMCHTPQTRYRLVTLWSSWCVTRDFNIKYMLVVPAANRWFENTISMLASEWSFLFWVKKFRILLQQDLNTQTSSRSQGTG
jgi:hypothetical protein